MPKVVCKDNLIYDATLVGKGKTCPQEAVIAIVTHGDPEEIATAINYYNDSRLDIKARIELIQENAQGALDFEMKPDRLPIENGLAHYKEMKWALERILQLIAGIPKEE